MQVAPALPEGRPWGGLWRFRGGGASLGSLAGPRQRGGQVLGLARRGLRWMEGPLGPCASFPVAHLLTRSLSARWASAHLAARTGSRAWWGSVRVGRVRCGRWGSDRAASHWQPGPGRGDGGRCQGAGGLHRAGPPLVPQGAEGPGYLQPGFSSPNHPPREQRGTVYL